MSWFLGPAALLTLLSAPSVSVLASPFSFRAPYTTFDAGFLTTGFATGDIDGDGHLDVVSCSEGDSSIAVVRGRGDGTFAPFVRYALGYRATDVTVVDLNGDGRLDVVVASAASTGSIVTVFLGTGGGSLGTPLHHTVSTTSYAGARIRSGDVDEDGTPDLVVTEQQATLAILPRAWRRNT